MKNRKVAGLVCLAALVGALTSGCASFKANRIPELGQLAPCPEGAARPTVSYSFTSGAEVFGKQEHIEAVRKKLEAEFVEVLKESGYFAEVSGDAGTADLALKVRLVNYGNPGVIVPAIITGLSLYTIPSWASDGYRVTANVTTKDAKQFSYEVDDAMTTVQWLPMIFVFPFKNMISTSLEVRKNIYKNLILKMQKDGVLPQPLSPKTAGMTIRVDAAV